MRNWAILILAALHWSQALAAGGKDLTYFCTTDASGGVSYNEVAKKWEATRFKPDGNFLLSMQYLRNSTDKGKYGDTEVNQYRVTITKAGDKYAAPCDYDFFFAHDDDRTFVPLTNNRLRCSANLKDYTFDLDTNRYLAAYL